MPNATRANCCSCSKRAESPGRCPTTALDRAQCRIVTTSIHQRIAEELGVRERQVAAAVDLLDGGATVPFIARYRKEATEMLDDAQLRTLEERLRYLRELEERRAAIIESIRSQGKLDDALEEIGRASCRERVEISGGGVA